VTLCSLVGICRRFGGNCYLHLPYFYSPLFLSTCPIVFSTMVYPFSHFTSRKYFLSLFLLDTLLLPRPFSWLILPRLLLVAASHWYALGTRLFLPLRIFYPEFCCMTYFSTLKMEAAILAEKTAYLYHLTLCHIASCLQVAGG